MSKLAVITGAADGIGKAIATEALAMGYRVVGVDVDAEKVEAARAELSGDLSFVLADLADAGAVQQAAEQIAAAGPVDLLVHNAGINAVGYFEGTDIAQQQAVIDVNLLAPLLLTRHLLAAGALSSDGSVVFVSSLSRYVSYPGASVYAATKDGLAAYARSLQVAYPKRHILTVYPGPTRTEHARRYSPDNSREDKRMLPSVLAIHILQAVEKRQRVLIPGRANWAFAIAGRLLPGLTDRVMRTSLLEKFPRP